MSPNPAEVAKQNRDLRSLVADYERWLSLRERTIDGLKTALFVIGIPLAGLAAFQLLFGLPYETLAAFPLIAAIVCILAGYHYRGVVRSPSDLARARKERASQAGITSPAD